MAQVISQGLILPSNVVAGGTIQAGDVTTLYNSLNTFSIPDAVASLFQASFVSNASQVAVGPATSTGSVIDMAINVPNTKAVFFLGSFSWATTGALGSLAFRANASTSVGSTAGYLVTPVVATTTSGNGMFFMTAMAHDASFTNPAINFMAMSTGNTFVTASTTALPAGSWSAIGIGLGTNSGTSTASGIGLTLGYSRVWREA